MSGVYIKNKAGKNKVRMIAIDDLREHKSPNIIKDIKLGSYEIFEIKPEKCGACNSNYIYQIELFGARHAPLLWECGKCNKAFLRFNAEATKEDLFYASEVWTNPQDWGYQEPSEFN